MSTVHPVGEGDGVAGTSALGAATPEQKLAIVTERMRDWHEDEVSFEVLLGGLANLSYVAHVGRRRYVVKLLTQEMDDFGLMIPMRHLLNNTEAAGFSGVGAQVLAVFPDLPAVVLEYINGRTLDTPDLADEALIPRLGGAVRQLHDGAPFTNRIQIWDFLDDYLGLVEKHHLPTPEMLLGWLGAVRSIQDALTANPLPLVPSHNDLLAKNVMDDGTIRLIDYDFSGMNDPCFDLGDLAMEGDYDPDQVERLCHSYFGEHRPTAVARARLYGIAAQYTWSLLFVGMDQLLPSKPDESFDYWAEAVSRWNWTRAKLESPELDWLIATARSGAGR